MTSSGAPHVMHISRPTEGGVARYVATVARDQIARGWRITVVAPDHGALVSMLAGTGATRVAWEAGRSPGPRTLVETVTLGRLVKVVAPDLVHLHSSKAGLAGRLALRGGTPTVFQPHGWSWLAVQGTMARLSTRWERWSMGWTDLCICVSDGEAQLAREAGVVGHLEVVHSGIDLDRFRPADVAARRMARSGLGIPAGIPLVVCPGRLSRQKGQDVLVRAWPSVRARLPDATLVLVGDGEPTGELLREGVRLEGAVDDVRPWLAAADVVAFPSRWEGLSLGLLEAMATGRSVVVSDVAGLREVVGESVGARVPPGDSRALGAALAERLANPALAAAEAAAALRVLREHGSAPMLDRLAALTLATLERSCRKRSIATE